MKIRQNSLKEVRIALVTKKMDSKFYGFYIEDFFLLLLLFIPGRQETQYHSVKSAILRIELRYLYEIVYDFF